MCGGGNGEVKQLLVMGDDRRVGICDRCVVVAMNAHKDIAEQQLNPIDWAASVEARAAVAAISTSTPPATEVEVRGKVLKPEPSFYSCAEDSERLTCTTPDEAIEEFIDQLWGDQPLPASITVYGWRRTALEPASWINARAIEMVLENLDEDFGDPDGDATDVTEPMKAAAKVFVDAVAAEYQLTSWPHEVDKDFLLEVNTREWIEEQAPEWRSSVRIEDE
jgi:hypothetical protein